eukprot:s876_g20.t1
MSEGDSPRTIVEFGTSHGFSALNWLHAIADDPDARVYSYDILPYPAAQALEDSDPRFIFHGKSQADFEAADVEGRPVEVAFFDAGHLVEYSLRAFERLLPSLTMNAIIAVHDTGLHVLDHGSGAPSEEEGLPFTEASCQRASSSMEQCRGPVVFSCGQFTRKLVTHCTHLYAPDVMPWLPCRLNRLSCRFVPRLAICAAVVACRPRPCVFFTGFHGNHAPVRQRGFGAMPVSRPTRRAATSFPEMAERLERCAQARGNGAVAQKKVELTRLFCDIKDVEEMKCALKLLLGHMKRTQVGTALLIAAADKLKLKKTKKPKEQLNDWLLQGSVADVGEGYQRLLEKESSKGGEKNLKLTRVWKDLVKISDVESKGAVKQREVWVADLSLRCGALGAKYLCRMLLGQGLRIGASRKTMAAAFAHQDLVPHGHRLLELLEVNPDLDAVVETLQTMDGSEVPRAQLWSPITPASAQAAKSVEEVMERIKKRQTIGQKSKASWRAEFKYDGERLQVHVDKQKGKVKFFSRNLKDVTERYPQIRAALLEDQNDFQQAILDGEVTAVDGDRILPFQILARRPRNISRADVKADDLADVRFFAFDCLMLDGESLLHQSLQQRIQELSSSIQDGSDRLTLAKGRNFTTAKQLQKVLASAINASTEGLMLKNLAAPYEPGIRTAEWLKLKKDYLNSSLSDSVDGVVVGVRRGKGRRSGVYGSFLLAVRSSTGRKFQTLCAVGTGLSDEAGSPGRFSPCATLHATPHFHVEVMVFQQSSPPDPSVKEAPDADDVELDKPREPSEESEPRSQLQPEVGEDTQQEALLSEPEGLKVQEVPEKKDPPAERLKEPAEASQGTVPNAVRSPPRSTVRCKVADLEDWLQELCLEEYVDAAAKWCAEMGAVSLEEIAENIEDFGADVSLKPIERQRVQKWAAQKLQGAVPLRKLALEEPSRPSRGVPRGTVPQRSLPGLWNDAPEWDDQPSWNQQAVAARENPVYTARSVRLAVDAQGNTGLDLRFDEDWGIRVQSVDPLPGQPGLAEGDFIVAIDGCSLRHRSHEECDQVFSEHLQNGAILSVVRCSAPRESHTMLAQTAGYSRKRLSRRGPMFKMLK